MEGLDKYPGRHIIFDLGGVLLNIDPERIMKEFPQMAQKIQGGGLAGLYETGKISTDDFLNILETATDFKAPRALIRAVWDGIILRFDEAAIQSLVGLKGKYRLSLLSNTNELHILYFEAIFKKQFPHLVWENMFDRIYYSCRLGMAKPDPEIYRYVLTDTGIPASETLFLDDNAVNLEAAAQLGIETRLVVA